jgi:hypothetical protein
MFISIRPVLYFTFLFNCLGSFAQSRLGPWINGAAWMDNKGRVINAHGAGILFYHGVYYLFGEIKKGKTQLVPNQGWEDYRVPAGGISCYTSKDLIHWNYEGVALYPVYGDPGNDLDTGRVIERPKVVYNARTKKFVMWMHIDKKDYSYSQAGVALSDRPIGPYQYLRSLRPNGNMSRDMTVYPDEDGKAYLVYSSEENNTMHICQLSDDYLSPSKKEERILINKRREAPALFKNKGKYFLISSACTGWSPNQASYAVADHPLGTWTEMGNPCIGPDADSSFHTQSTYVLPVPGKPDSFIFMADRWNKLNLEDSRYVWLPLEVKGVKVEIYWREKAFQPD